MFDVLVFLIYILATNGYTAMLLLMHDFRLNIPPIDEPNVACGRAKAGHCGGHRKSPGERRRLRKMRSISHVPLRYSTQRGRGVQSSTRVAFIWINIWMVSVLCDAF